MSLKKISYKKIKKCTKDKLYSILRELFPELKYSTPDKYGILKLKQKGILGFLRKPVKIHLYTLLFNHIPFALSVKYFGNDNPDFISKLYHERLDVYLNNYRNSESLSIDEIIRFFYNECFNKHEENTQEPKTDYILFAETTTSSPSSSREVNWEKPITTFLDFIYLLRLPKKAPKNRNKLKKYIIVAALVGLLSTTTPVLAQIASKLDTFALRAPPLFSTIFNNST